MIQGPRRIEVDPGVGLVIEWPDGHQSRFPMRELRAMCPCAACRDPASAGAAALRVAERPEAFQLVRVEPVGRYAVSLVWRDGHSTGIYTWEYLRDRCACFSCRRAGAGDRA